MSLSRRYKHEARARNLWFDCLLLSRLTSRPEHTDLFPLVVAEAAYAAAWASLDLQPSDEHRRSKLQDLLHRTAGFLHSLKPDRSQSSASQLRERLLRIGGQGDSRTEIWAYLLGHWVQTACGVKAPAKHEELLELGWSPASFGLGYWTGATVLYRRRGELHRLILPFERKDALELLGPFETLTDSIRQPSGQRVMLASLSATRGLNSPPLWKLECMLAGFKGVALTKTGHVHRQFAGADLPEWFEAIEVTYHKSELALGDLLIPFWRTFHSGGDLVFYTEPSQRKECLVAWKRFVATQPSWAVSKQLMLQEGTWFDPAPPENQKLALLGYSVLQRPLSGLDLTHSYLATKLNAFAGGHGSDEDVVLLAARFGLSPGLTTTLRTIRYFSAQSRAFSASD